MIWKSNYYENTMMEIMKKPRIYTRLYILGERFRLNSAVGLIGHGSNQWAEGLTELYVLKPLLEGGTSNPPTARSGDFLLLG